MTSEQASIDGLRKVLLDPEGKRFVDVAIILYQIPERRDWKATQISKLIMTLKGVADAFKIPVDDLIKKIGES